MNMISTGSFLTETGASNKQSELVKKLTAAWEKKNSKTARAGGASLMALSLAACGGEDNTPFSQADVDAAVAAVDITTDNAEAMTSNDAEIAAAAKTEALTAADGTIYTSVDAAYTAGNNVTNAAAVEAALTDASGVKHNNVDAAITSNDATVEADATAAAEATLVAGSGFSSVADLLAAYTAAVAPSSSASITLTSSSDRMVEQFTGVDDTVTGAFGTVNAGDIIIDSYTTDADVANLTIDTAIAATIANIETINIDARDNANADQFVVDALNMSGYNRLSVDSNYSEVDFLVNDLESGSTLAIDSTTTSLTFNMNRTGSAESHTTSATVEIDGGTTGVTSNFDKGTTDDVDALTIHSVGSKANVLTLDETEDYLSTTASPDSLTVSGTNSITLVMSQEVDAQGFDGATITNSMSGDATFTLRLTDDDANGDTALEGAQIDLDSVNADIIELDTITQDSTDLKVASGATIQTKAADDIRGDILITSATAGGVLNLNLKASEVNTSTDTIEFVSAGTVNIANTAVSAITYTGTDITTSYAGIGNSTDLNISQGAGMTIDADIAAEAGSTLDAVTITGTKDIDVGGSITAASLTVTGEDIVLETNTTTAGVSLTASKSVDLQEVLAGTDNASSLTINAGTTVTLDENIGASGTEIGNVDITAGTSFTGADTNSEMDINGTLTINAGTTVRIGDSADVASTGAISVVAGTTNTIDGDLVSAAGGITVTAGTALEQEAAGAITATTGDINITAGTTYTTASAVTASAGDLTISAVSSDINAALDGDNVSITGSSATTNTTISAAITGATTFSGAGHTFVTDKSFTADTTNDTIDITGNVVVSGGASLEWNDGEDTDNTAGTGAASEFDYNTISGSVTHSGSGTVDVGVLAGDYIGGDATGAVTIIRTATGADSITTGSGADSITLGDVETAVVSGAGNDTINAAGVTTTTNMVNINAGDGNDNITAGAATDDVLTGGAGTDTFVIASDDVVSFSERITDFEVGSAGDILSFDVSEIDSLGGDATSTTITKIDTTDTGTTTFADTQLIVLTGTQYADVAAVVSALNGASGKSGNVDANSDGIITIFADTDGHSYITVLEGDGSNDFSGTDAELVRLDGLTHTDLANLTQDNFIIA